MLEHLRLLSRYNLWMNDKLYNTASQLTAEEFAKDRGAYFGSLLGTLNHIMVADIVWLQRFAMHPKRYPALEEMKAMSKPQALDELLFEDFHALNRARRELDETIVTWCEQIESADLDHVLMYLNMMGETANKNFGSLMLHFFNHQTHHRGQATTLLYQQGLDVGVTDLLVLIASD